MQVCYEDLKRCNERFEPLLIEAARDVVTSGWYVLGPVVEHFETCFAEAFKGKHCVSVASGLDALKLSLLALDFPEGSEVILPSNAYIADVLAVIQSGCEPVLVEPDIRTYNIDPSRIEAAITEKTVAVMPIHLYGKPADMLSIMSLAEKYQLKVIEDAAQAHAAQIGEQCVGTFGDCGAFSFYPTKNLGAFGDGGAVIAKDERVANRLRVIRDYGSEKKNIHEVEGVNSRLDTIQAALLSVKLKHLNEITAHKRMLADIYNERLSDCVIKPVIQVGVKDVFHIYAIRHPERDRLKEALEADGIKTAIHYPTPVFDQPAFSGKWNSKNYPISNEIHRTVLSLPISFGHTREEIEYVCKIINKVA